MANQLIDILPQVAYTHGLERIYSLETVDISSVRTIGQAKPQVLEVKKNPKKVPHQLCFDFGPGFRSWMTPIVWHEPISVLGLSHHTEKALQDAGKCTLADVRDFDFQQLSLGRGHVDEIISKLESYLDGVDTDKTTIFDVGSCLRALLSHCECRASYAFLQNYSLQDLCLLSASAVTELKRAPLEKIFRLKENALTALQSTSSKQLAHELLTEVLNAFVVPWMRRRGGVATESEMVEHLEKASYPSKSLKPFLSLIKDVYGRLDLFLESISGVFCSDHWIAEETYRVIQCVYSYFYRKDVWYELKHLTQLVQNELAKQWICVGSEFVKRILSACSLFRVRITSAGRIVHLV